jgi:hypothetical protein
MPVDAAKAVLSKSSEELAAGQQPQKWDSVQRHVLGHQGGGLQHRLLLGIFCLQAEMWWM